MWDKQFTAGSGSVGHTFGVIKEITKALRSLCIFLSNETDFLQKEKN